MYFAPQINTIVNWIQNNYFNVISTTLMLTLLFDGVELFDFVEIEDLFQVNIVVYSLNETSAQLVHRSRGFYKDTTKLNLFENHFSLIHDFEKYCNVYRCVKCDQQWYQNHNYLQLIKHCTGKV